MKQQGNPWWKEPWPWLLMSGPLAAIIGCGITIWLAATHPDPAIDGAERQGLVVQKAAARATSAPADHARHP